MEKDYGKASSDNDIRTAAEALKVSGFEVIIEEDRQSAKERALSLIPKGSEVMNMTSVTLTESGIEREIMESGDYEPVKAKLSALDDNVEQKKKREMGAAPDYAIGSVHAITKDGKVLIASNTGSQLPAHAYASPKVIFVVGSQKIVEDMEEGLDRIYKHSLPLEDKRALKAYGVNSFVSKILILNKEQQPGRISIIIVKEAIGY